MRRGLGAAAGVAVLALALLLTGSLGLFGGATQREGAAAAARTSSIRPVEPTDRLDASIDSLQARVRGNSADWEAAASLGIAYLQKARLTANPVYHSKAAAALKRSARLHPKDNYEASLGRGILAGARHDFPAALRWGRAAARINPYDADARGVIVDALVELGRYDPARRELQEMVDLRPDLASFARISYYRELHGDTRGAVAAMIDAFEAVGGNGQEASWTSYELGELYFNSGRLGKASFAYRRGAFLAPGYHLPRVGLARVAAARGRLGRAIRILRPVARTYPTPAVVMMLGDLHAAAGDDDAAARQYALVGAEQKLFAANGVAPDVEVINFYSDHSKKVGWALRTARREYRVRPSVRVADALAWALYANHDYDEALVFARRALSLGTRDATYRWHAGMIAKKAGRDAEARAHLRAALRINPHFSVLHEKVARRALRDLS